MDGNESFGLCPFRVVLTDAQTLCQLKTLGGKSGERLAHGSYLPAMGTYGFLHFLRALRILDPPMEGFEPV